MAQGDTNTSVDPLWFKDAIIYELHVKTFCDSDGDGMGDFRGLIEKLDYRNSGPADVNKSDASSRPSPPGPMPSWMSRNL